MKSVLNHTVISFLLTASIPAYAQTGFSRDLTLPAPIATPANPASAASPSTGTPRHELFGAWRLTWLDTMMSNDVRIVEVKQQPTYTDAFGTVQSGGEQCKFEMTVMNTIKGIVPRPGPPALPDVTINIPTWSALRITCATVSVFGYGLGGSGTQAAVLGRASVNVAGQPVQNQPWALSRPVTQ